MTAIEETKNLESLKFDEVIGSLYTFEMNLDESQTSRSKGERSIALYVYDEVPIPNSIAKEGLQE